MITNISTPSNSAEIPFDSIDSAAPNFDADQMAAVLSALPTDSVLTRMANEMFSASPGGAPSLPSSAPSMPASVPSSLPPQVGRSLPMSPSTSEFGKSEEQQMRELLSPTSAAPAVSRAPSERLAAGNSYYFLPRLPAVARDATPTAPDLTNFDPGQLLQSPPAHRPFDVHSIRRDFPILQERVNGRPLVWLDNAATTQKPQAVIARIEQFYQHENSNIHRAAHELARRSTDAYEGARKIVAKFLNAPSSDQIVFVRGATEAINLVAQSWARQYVGQGDEVVITWLEHHANIVPWQQLCAEKGALLRVVPVDETGQIMLDEYQKLLGPRTKLVSLPTVSNALGTVTPAKEMVEMAHRYGAKVLVDGAQSVSHMRSDVSSLDCDWFVLSGHKVFAPTGIGVLYGKSDVLEAMPPWQGGGNMIEDVTFERTTYQSPPARFEAGTGNIADAVGLGAALEYVDRIGIDNITRYEHDLLAYATQGLTTIPGLKLIGTAPEKAGVLSFVIDGIETQEIGKALSQDGIAVRAGHHCAQPILRRFGVESTVRPSFALYNTCQEIDLLIAAVRDIQSGSKPVRR